MSLTSLILKFCLRNGDEREKMARESSPFRASRSSTALAFLLRFPTRDFIFLQSEELFKKESEPAVTGLRLPCY